MGPHLAQGELDRRDSLVSVELGGVEDIQWTPCAGKAFVFGHSETYSRERLSGLAKRAFEMVAPQDSDGPGDGDAHRGEDRHWIGVSEGSEPFEPLDQVGVDAGEIQNRVGP
jgi:hypothetical protein